MAFHFVVAYDEHAVGQLPEVILPVELRRQNQGADSAGHARLQSWPALLSVQP